jgi:hypothetical protein
MDVLLMDASGFTPIQAIMNGPLNRMVGRVGLEPTTKGL